MLLLKIKQRTTKNQHKESPGQVGRDFFVASPELRSFLSPALSAGSGTSQGEALRV